MNEENYLDIDEFGKLLIHLTAYDDYEGVCHQCEDDKLIIEWRSFSFSDSDLNFLPTWVVHNFSVEVSDEQSNMVKVKIRIPMKTVIYEESTKMK